ncbi:hypothetical protein PNIG_a1805 [Pseudoalteromonas nigrifaciens]|uniref:Lipoprotein n=1 Tax=Pseudoalteromonas nigrifaciens TaxID=28109 RepID=A0AAC9UHU2_9GAMM|nr:hypothetical protein [Pseudoalteromonas nigrifaciens]ASM53903.1 hypothetical protein PNIG_a1805 [Pseudoalteromonas nigrifaciens]GEN43602.1 hypothetical protein PNI02_30680 [Pseudoalteromonas nigrifaciens]SUC52257.1 Uncharacterised protein [Pseudoalteromonas nigrifaciens]
MVNRILILIAILFIYGCSSTHIIKSETPISADKCNVKIYSSLQSAQKHGEIEELCIVTGTSSGSFSHTVGTAINKHSNKVCDCGANKAFIQAQDAGTLGTASVTLVGFKHINKKTVVKDKKIYELAKKCQLKGGVWINDICQIELD